MEFKEQIEWCIERHRLTNHMYDKYLPYEFHLRMVVQVCKEYIGKFTYDAGIERNITLACWGHDLIEDTRTPYNDCKEILGSDVADIIYAVTNNKGKNRAERANDDYYQGIIHTGGAVFVKLCDRIANVQYSKLTKSKMFQMYKQENPDFEKKIYKVEFEQMFKYLRDLFVE